MRSLLGSLFILASAYFTFQFGVLGGNLAAGTPESELTTAPFKLLGGRYPMDVSMLAAAVWSIGLGLYLLFSSGKSSVLPSHVPTTSRWAQRLLAQHGQRTPMAAFFVLNAFLLATVVFMAYIGAKVHNDSRHLKIFELVAGLQVFSGFLLLVLALFEKPKAPVSLILGSAVYLAGTSVGVLAFLWGQPAA